MPKRSSVKLTHDFCERAAPGEKERTFSDCELAGFELRVYPSGRKVFAFRYGSARLRLGEFPALSAKAARAEAMKARVAVDQGRDPAAEKREAKSEERAVLRTFGDMLESYLAHAEKRVKTGKLSASTLKLNRGRLNKHARPTLGSCGSRR
jgi:hypothetical protein